MATQTKEAPKVGAPEHEVKFVSFNGDDGDEIVQGQLELKTWLNEGYAVEASGSLPLGYTARVWFLLVKRA